MYIILFKNSNTLRQYEMKYLSFSSLVLGNTFISFSYVSRIHSWPTREHPPIINNVGLGEYYFLSCTCVEWQMMPVSGVSTSISVRGIRAIILFSFRKTYCGIFMMSDVHPMLLLNWIEFILLLTYVRSVKIR